MNLRTALLRCSILASILLIFPFASLAEQAAPRILFDQGHKQRFVIEQSGDLQLSRLAGVMRSQGAVVESSKATLSDETLKGYAALVISGPFEQLSDNEVDAVTRFVNRGGRLAVMMHIGSPLAGLFNRFDLDFSNAVLHERQNVIDNDLNFKVTDLSADSPLFKGISRFSVYGAWALREGKNSVVIARTSPDAWVDLNHDGVLSKGDAVGSFGAVVLGKRGAGYFVVFGDDAIFQNKFLDENNARLAANLADWLMGR